jgi:two-component system, cell cycle response regulator CpdR
MARSFPFSTARSLESLFMSKILIIDDAPEVQRYITRILTGMGHEVVVADDGEQGHLLAQDEGIDVIMTDLAMPGELCEMDLVRALRKARPECPIVVCSGYPTPERIQECEELHIFDFLAKPFEVAFIESVINRLLAEAEQTGRD